MKKLFAITLLASSMSVGASGALADGPTVIVEPPVTPPPIAPVRNWAGGYAGLSLGYSNMDVEDMTSGAGEFSASGGTLGGFAGYNFQNGNLVFGPELHLSFSDVDGTDGANMNPFQLENSIELRGRVGYDAGRTLPYLALGVVSSEFAADYVGAGNAADMGSDRFTGITLAAGVDYMVSDRMFLRGEVQAVRYNDDTLGFYGGGTTNTIEASDLRLSIGAGFRF